MRVAASSEPAEQIRHCCYAYAQAVEEFLSQVGTVNPRIAL